MLVNEPVNHSNLLLIKSNILNQFLQDTLDTLFGILDESSQKYALKVFDCLVGTDPHFCAQIEANEIACCLLSGEFFIIQVHIINLLQDSKFQHFKPVMDTYIESHFAGALSYRYIKNQKCLTLSIPGIGPLI